MRRKWVKFLNFLLIIAVIYLSANTFFFIKSYGREKAEVDISAPPSSQSFQKSGRSISDYAVVYRRNLFGVEEIPKPTAPSRPLLLKLKGTVVGTEEFTFCIIEDRTQRKEDLYQKGDTIQDMKISDITENSVVLSKGAEKIVLYIDEDEKNVVNREEPVIASKPPKYPDLTDIAHPSENKWVVSKEDVLEAAGNISSIMADFKIRPHFSDGKMQGFRIDDIKNDTIASLIGVEKGDIVKKINGETIDSPKKVFDFYRNLERSSVIELEVERGDSTEVFTYEVK